MVIDQVHCNILKLHVHEGCGPKGLVVARWRLEHHVQVIRCVDVNRFSEVKCKQAPDEFVLINVNDGMDSGQHSLDAQVRDIMTEALVQVPLHLQLELQLVSE